MANCCSSQWNHAFRVDVASIIEHAKHVELLTRMCHEASRELVRPCCLLLVTSLAYKNALHSLLFRQPPPLSFCLPCLVSASSAPSWLSLPPSQLAFVPTTPSPPAFPMALRRSEASTLAAGSSSRFVLPRVRHTCSLTASSSHGSLPVSLRKRETAP